MPKYQINWYPIHISGFDENILAPVVVHNGRAFVFDGGLVETSVNCLPTASRIDILESEKTTLEFYKITEECSSKPDMNAGKYSNAIYEFLGSCNNPALVTALGLAAVQIPLIGVGGFLGFLGLAGAASSSRWAGK